MMTGLEVWAVATVVCATLFILFHVMDCTDLRDVVVLVSIAYGVYGVGFGLLFGMIGAL